MDKKAQNIPWWVWVVGLVALLVIGLMIISRMKPPAVGMP